MERDAPQRAENDDARHVQGPTGEIVLAHPRRTHAVEEKLQIPSDPGDRRKQVVPQPRGRAGKVFAAGAIAEIEHHAPDEVGGETARQHDDEDRQILPEVTAIVLAQRTLRDLRERLAGGESVGEARTHDPGEHRHDHAFAEVELLHCGRFLLG